MAAYIATVSAVFQNKS